MSFVLTVLSFFWPLIASATALDGSTSSVAFALMRHVSTPGFNHVNPLELKKLPAGGQRLNRKPLPY